MTRRGVLVLGLGLGAGLLLALVVVVLVRGVPFGGEAGRDDPAAEEAPEPDAPSRTADGPDADGEPGEAGEGADGPTTSAATGPEGTRDLEEVPDELPTALVVDDAVGLEATVARGGDDWSASLTYRTAQDRETLTTSVDDVLEAEGYTLRRRSSDDRRTTSVYDGQDRSVLTTTVLLDEPLTLLHAVRVSP